MRNKFLILIFVLVLPIVFGDLILSPNPADVNVKYNEREDFQVKLTNTYDFKIFGFDFCDIPGFSFYDDIELDAGENVDMNYSILRDDLGEYDYACVVSFKYYVDLPEDEQEHNISITDQGYDPDYLVIRQGDTVIWRNEDDITHSITSGLWDYDLAPNTSKTLVLNDVGIIDYQDLILFFSGTIEVLNSTSQEAVHNTNYDKTWNVDLEVNLDPTTLNFTLDNNNYNISYNNSVEGILTIENIGDIIAQNIELSSDPSWIKWDENNFDLDPGENNIVTYHINPAIFQTEDTNKTYNLSIYVDGANTPKYSKKSYVFIPYENIFNTITSNEGIVSFILKVCENNPQLFFCNTSIPQDGCECEPCSNQDVMIPVNLSQRDVLSMFKTVQGIKDSGDRTNNEVKLALEIVNKHLPIILKQLNESNVMQKENEEKINRTNNVIWIVGFFVLLIILIIVVMFLLGRKRSKESIADSHQNYQG